MKINDGDTLLLTGDSITDCGRDHPVGRNGGLGDGYAEILDRRLKDSKRDITILNTGISGNRVPDLQYRWQKDVLNHAPDWLSVLIGINDVWYQFESPLAMEPVLIEDYENTYRQLLDQTVPTLKGLILMTPYVIEPDKSEPMRRKMVEYSEVVKRIADDYDALFVDLQGAFDEYLSRPDAISLADDRIHPNSIGHGIIADSFLKVIDAI